MPRAPNPVSSRLNLSHVASEGSLSKRHPLVVAPETEEELTAMGDGPTVEEYPADVRSQLAGEVGESTTARVTDLSLDRPMIGSIASYLG